MRHLWRCHSSRIPYSGALQLNTNIVSGEKGLLMVRICEKRLSFVAKLNDDLEESGVTVFTAF